MKKIKKIMALVIAMVMVLSMSATVFAQTEAYNGEGADGAKITISNAAKGETYSVVKLFDATVTDTTDGPIAYQGTIPDSLSAYFTKNATTGEITATDIAKDGDELSTAAVAALKTWAQGQTATKSATSDGSTLEFTNLPYGYYVVLTTQGTGTVTVTNTNPNATVVDKNTTEATIQKKVKDDAGNWVEVTDANIGESKDFKLDINTTNWHQPLNEIGQPTGDQKKVKQYIIGEDFDTNKFELISIDSVQVGILSENTFSATETINGKTSFPITIDWVDGNGKSKYDNGSVIRVLYRAKLKDDAVIDVGNTSADLRGNVNTADLDWKYTDDSTHFGEKHDHLQDKAAVDTYAIAIKKFDKNGTALSGATFKFPFYVKKTAAADGSYIYAFDTLPATFADGDSAANYTNEITTPTDGQITIKGVKAGTYSNIEETAAPDGYNKASEKFSVTAVKISTTTTVTRTSRSWKIDQNGNVTDLMENDPETVTKTTYTNNSIAATAIPVINLQGATLPSTGGIGTTIFYVIGAILVLGAGILLVTRRRMNAN